MKKKAPSKIGRGTSTALDAWRRSETWKRIASANARANLRAFALRPRCGAKTKGTGDPCKQPALANGKCGYHGGRTPVGVKWHQAIFSPGTTRNGDSKLDRKLFDIGRAEKRRARQLAKMAPERRAAYERWHQAHHPVQSVRMSRRQAKAQAREAKAYLEMDEPTTPEIIRIGELIRRLTLEAEVLVRAAEAAQADIEDSSNDDVTTSLGIFG